MRDAIRQEVSGARKRGAATALPIVLLLVFAGSAGSQAPPSAQEHAPGSFRISVNAALVVLHATVTDSHGVPLSTLGEQQFEVYEDGVRQRISLFKNEDVPVTVGLVVDHSTTMGPKITEVISAARIFARSSNPDDEMFVVNFHEVVSLGLPRTIRFTSNVAELQSAIMTAPTGGETALYAGIAKALEELRAGHRDKKVLIVISDGGDNASARSLDQVMKLAGESSAVIYTVGLFDENDPDRNPGVLKRLAQATGGEAFLPSRLTEVVAVCERIARDIRHQYTIGYIPLLTRKSGYRAIRVVPRTKDGHKLTVRTRTGYIAGGEQRLPGTTAQ